MISFTAYGHENIRALHKNTIEFTRDKEVSPSGDCILGVNSDYDLSAVKKFISGKEKVKCVIEADNVSDEFEFAPNPKFDDNNEMVFRLGEFASERTLGLRASKAAKHIKREIADKMKIPGKKMKIILQMI